jgi:hypothetical protein
LVARHRVRPESRRRPAALVARVPLPRAFPIPRLSLAALQQAAALFSRT